MDPFNRMKVDNKIMNNDWTALYLGIYGILIQIISFAAIYLFSNYLGIDSVEYTTKILIYIWYLLPLLALLPLALAILQIRQRKTEVRPFKKPMLGLLVNAAWILAIIVFLAMGFGCGAQQDENKNKLENMNAQEILEALSVKGYPNDSAAIYTDNGSNSGYPWSIKGCTSAVNWTITLGNQGQESSGIIEVYNNVANCTARKDSAKSISSFASPEQDYFIQEGVVFMQIPFDLKPNEAAQFEAALQAMAQGKLPSPYEPDYT